MQLIRHYPTILIKQAYSNSFIQCVGTKVFLNFNNHPEKTRSTGLNLLEWDYCKNNTYYYDFQFTKGKL